LSNKSILVLDEDPDILVFLTVLLEECGIRVLRARSRAEALELVRRRFVAIDLILANIVITHLSDTNFEKDIANLRAGIPILYMSAFVEDGAIRIEMMKRPHSVSGTGESSSAIENESLVNVVMGALTKSRTRASSG
jgi:CheY-like chemotaxis protein